MLLNSQLVVKISDCLINVIFTVILYIDDRLSFSHRLPLLFFLPFYLLAKPGILSQSFP